jgi:hypothetical protein
VGSLGWGTDSKYRAKSQWTRSVASHRPHKSKEALALFRMKIACREDPTITLWVPQQQQPEERSLE